MWSNIINVSYNTIFAFFELILVSESKVLPFVPFHCFYIPWYCSYRPRNQQTMSSYFWPLVYKQPVPWNQFTVFDDVPVDALQRLNRQNNDRRHRKNMYSTLWKSFASFSLFQQDRLSILHLHDNTVSLQTVQDESGKRNSNTHV
jgi:hypothetical protein